MAYENIIVENDGPACIVTLNRPESRNSFSVATMAEVLAAAQADVLQDPTVFTLRAQ